MRTPGSPEVGAEQSKNACIFIISIRISIEFMAIFTEVGKRFLCKMLDKMSRVCYNDFDA